MSKTDLEKRLIKSISDLEGELMAIEQKKDEIEEKLEKLRGLRSAFEELTPDLLSMLLDASVDEETGEEPQGTHFERIARFLREHDAPQTIAAIEQGTRIPRASISAVLYRTHPEMFVNYDLEQRPGRGRAKMWRLKNPVRDGAEADSSPPVGYGEPDPFEEVPGGNPEDDIPF